MHVTLRAQKVRPSLKGQLPHAVVRAALDAVRRKTEDEKAPFQLNIRKHSRCFRFDLE